MSEEAATSVAISQCGTSFLKNLICLDEGKKGLNFFSISNWTCCNRLKYILIKKEKTVGNCMSLSPLRYWQRVWCSVSFSQSRTVHLLDEAADLNVRGACAKQFSLFLSCVCVVWGIGRSNSIKERRTNKTCLFHLVFYYWRLSVCVTQALWVTALSSWGRGVESQNV